MADDLWLGAAEQAASVRAAVAERVRVMLAATKKLPRAAVDLVDDDDFLQVLRMDSIDAVELTVQLDLLFDVGFGTDPDDLDSLASFGSLVDLVLARGRLEALSDDDVAVDEWA